MNETVEYMTEEGLARLQEKLKQAESKLAELQSRRQHIIGADGDGPHDNFAFEQLEIEERGLQRTVVDLRRQISNAKIIQSPQDSESVQRGSTVIIRFEEGQLMTVKILGSADSNPAAGIISDKSPLGSQLLGKRVGDSIKYSAGGQTITARIESVSS